MKNEKVQNKKIIWALRIALAIVVLGLPVFCGKSTLRILNQAEIQIIFALSMNLLMGYGGILSLGHAAFFGIGAYTATLLCMNLGWSFIPSLLVSVVFTGLVGAVFALPLSRIKGKYVVIVTLAYCEIVNLIMQNWDSLTRGTRGIMGIPRATIFGYKIKDMFQNYYLVLIMIIITYVFIRWIRYSKFGRNLLAIREDPIAAEAMGVRIVSNQILVFSISAALAAVAGSLYPHYMSYISPDSFTSDLSLTCVSIIVIGGLGNMKGTIIATLFMVILPQYMRDFGNYRMVAYGVLLIVVMWLNHSVAGIRCRDAVIGRLKLLRNFLAGKVKKKGVA